MTRHKRAHSIGYLMGRYVVGPLVLLVIIGALLGLLALLVVGIGNTLGA